MKECEKFAPLLSAFIDGELTEEERAVLLSATKRYVTGCKNAMKGL